MKIAFLHYHLKPGGVTTVVRHQIDALKNTCSLLVLSGVPPQDPLPVPVRHIPGIAYDNGEKKAQSPQEIAQEILTSIFDHWEDGCDLLHVHNPFLAKNRALLDILKVLQTRGVRLFLQVHDFAEDGRPQVYYRESYPRDCHYGVINSRDYKILLGAGLKTEGLHMIPSPVKSLNRCEPPSSQTGTVLYPIRAIRRKNIGEALLLSLYFRPGEHLSITLPPNSPDDLIAYQGWKRFSAENRMGVLFDTGLETDLAALVERSSYVVTTSITEGFGYTFLEAWTAGKPVWGRDLADITHDFKRKGLDLDHLYQRLMVPLSWIDHQRYFNRRKTCILNNCERFDLDPNIETIEKSADRMLASALVDFGLLDESFQKDTIRKLLAEPGNKDYLANINPFLANPFSTTAFGHTINNNRGVISQSFSSRAYGDDLLKTYDTAIQNGVHQHIDKKMLAAAFFDFDSFSLLKWGQYVE